LLVPREHCLDRDEPEDLSRRAALEDGYEWWISQPFHAAAKITRSLIGLTLIEGSCPEVGVFGPLDLQDGTGPVIASRSVG
jgi:hypothetical protein